MSAIYLDPAAMDATAGAVAEHAREVDTAIGDLESACAAEVPPSLADWLADELHDIAVHARLAEVLYLVAALDTALRAEQIQADQSLATAWPGPTVSVIGGTGPAIAGTTGPSTVAVGGTGPAIAGTAAVSTVAVGGSSPFPGGVTGGQWVMALAPLDFEAFAGLNNPDNYPGASGFVDVADRARASADGNLFAPSGTTFSHGVYIDDRGNRGPLSAVYVNPRDPGRHEVRS
jgi:hypothetical protein